MDRDKRIILYHRVDQSTEIPMLILAVAFLFVLVIPEIVALPPDVHDSFLAVEWLIWGIFAFELVLKTYLSPNRIRYLLTHWMDVVVVVFPFLRPLRLLRIIAITTRSWTTIRSILRNQTAGVITIIGLGSIVVGSTLVYLFEYNADGPITSYPDALWWGMTTITTVGYGDTYPVTNVGRGVAVFLMVAGISLFGLLTARVAAFFVEDEPAQQTPDPAVQFDAILERLERIEAQNQELRQQLRSIEGATGDR